MSGGDLQDVRLIAELAGAKVEKYIECIEYELAHKMNNIYNLENLVCKFKGLDNQMPQMKYKDGMTLSSIVMESNYS